jgi:hypothetical protein
MIVQAITTWWATVTWPGSGGNVGNRNGGGWKSHSPLSRLESYPKKHKKNNNIK